MNSRHGQAASLLGEFRDFDEAFERSFSLVAFVMNRHLIDHMLRVARSLTLDDFEAMIIWGVLAHQNIAHLMPPGSVPAAILTEQGRLDTREEGMRPLRLRDLVQITRIPRETVRRKLKLLEQERWIECTPKGWVCGTERVEPMLRDFTRESARRFLMAADEMMRVLRAAEGQQAPRSASAPEAPPHVASEAARSAR